MEGAGRRCAVNFDAALNVHGIHGFQHGDLDTSGLLVRRFEKINGEGTTNSVTLPYILTFFVFCSKGKSTSIPALVAISIEPLL